MLGYARIGYSMQFELLIKIVWGAFFWVVCINLVISGAKVKGRNYFTKCVQRVHFCPF
jgi:hypothetical protein